MTSGYGKFTHSQSGRPGSRHPFLASTFSTLAHAPCFGNHRLPSWTGALSVSPYLQFSFEFFLSFLWQKGSHGLEGLQLCCFPDCTMDFFLCLTHSMGLFASGHTVIGSHFPHSLSFHSKLPFSRSLVGCWRWEYLLTAWVACM